MNESIRRGIKWLQDHAYILNYTVPDSVICHHGIPEQKWGVRNGPPYPLSSQKTIKNSAGQTVRIVRIIKLSGEVPNAITQVVRKNGGIDRNFYDEDGRQIKQISNHDHGNKENHPYGKNGEHAHDYIYSKSGELIGRPTRKLTDQERKDNGDLL